MTRIGLAPTSVVFQLDATVSLAHARFLFLRL
jgi:hypothetical protein